MKTREIHIGNKVIGGGNPILIQSMTNTKTEDVKGTVAQINALASAGCDIIRCAVPTIEAAAAGSGKFSSGLRKRVGESEKGNPAPGK